MDSGIAYLKDVIVNVRLVISQELETKIAGLICNSKCAWKEAIENNNIRQNFTDFVNAPEVKDAGVNFTPLKDQKKLWSGQNKLLPPPATAAAWIKELFINISF